MPRGAGRGAQQDDEPSEGAGETAGAGGKIAIEQAAKQVGEATRLSLKNQVDNFANVQDPLALFKALGIPMKLRHVLLYHLDRDGEARQALLSARTASELLEFFHAWIQGVEGLEEISPPDDDSGYGALLTVLVGLLGLNDFPASYELQADVVWARLAGVDGRPYQDDVFRAFAREFHQPMFELYREALPKMLAHDAAKRLIKSGEAAVRRAEAEKSSSRRGAAAAGADEDKARPAGARGAEDSGEFGALKGVVTADGTLRVETGKRYKGAYNCLLAARVVVTGGAPALGEMAPSLRRVAELHMEDERKRNERTVLTHKYADREELGRVAHGDIAHRARIAHAHAVDPTDWQPSLWDNEVELRRALIDYARRDGDTQFAVEAEKLVAVFCKLNTAMAVYRLFQVRTAIYNSTQAYDVARLSLLLDMVWNSGLRPAADGTLPEDTAYTTVWPRVTKEALQAMLAQICECSVSEVMGQLPKHRDFLHLMSRNMRELMQDDNRFWNKGSGPRLSADADATANATGKDGAAAKATRRGGQ